GVPGVPPWPLRRVQPDLRPRHALRPEDGRARRVDPDVTAAGGALALRLPPRAGVARGGAVRVPHAARVGVGRIGASPSAAVRSLFPRFPPTTEVQSTHASGSL